MLATLDLPPDSSVRSVSTLSFYVVTGLCVHHPPRVGPRRCFRQVAWEHKPATDIGIQIGALRGSVCSDDISVVAVAGGRLLRGSGCVAVFMR